MLEVFPFDGFGRFGRVTDENGYLTYNFKAGVYSEVRGEDLFALKFTRDGKTLCPKATKVSALEALYQDPSGDSVQTSILHPGFVAKLARSGTIDVSAKGLTAKVEQGHILLVSSSKSFSPVAISGPRLKIETQTENRVTISALPGEVKVVWPKGIEREVEPTREEIGFWLNASIPKLQSVTYRNGVETYRFRPLDHSVAPPVYGHYAEQLGARNLLLMMETRYGNLYGSKQNTIQLPLPNYLRSRRGYVRQHDQSTNLVSSFVTDPLVPWAKNAVDLGFSRRVPGLMAGPYLSDDLRSQIVPGLKEGLAKAFTIPGSAWQMDTEPLTGIQFPYTYTIDGPRNLKYDVEWGNMLPVYGLYQYALATGDYAFVRQCWPGVRKALQFVLKSQDWAWMTGVNADHGFSTGTGDPLNASYVGMIAAAELANSIGLRSEAERYEWIVRRMAVPTMLRLRLSEWSEKRELTAKSRFVLGFHETENFTRSGFKGDPWFANTLFSGNGIFPELFELYKQYEPNHLRSYLGRIETAFPRWFDGLHKYDYSTTYNGNSGYVTFPQIYARMTAGEPMDKVWNWITSASTNRVHSWVAPNVIAEAFNREHGFVLTDWGALGYLGGTFDQEGWVTLKFQSQTKNPNVVRYTVPAGRRIVELWYNGRELKSISQKEFVLNPEREVNELRLKLSIVMN